MQPTVRFVSMLARAFDGNVPTIIIGGTGMLRAASIELAARSKRFTAIARTTESLDRLDAALKKGRTLHHRLQLDWSYPDIFLDRIEKHVSSTEPPDIVVGWIHDDQPALRLARMLAANITPVRFFHIIGAASVNPPTIADELVASFEPPSSLDYRQVILGAHDEGRTSRWLTHQEISDGVIEATNNLEARFVIGTLGRYGEK